VAVAVAAIVAIVLFSMMEEVVELDGEPVTGGLVVVGHITAQGCITPSASLLEKLAPLEKVVTEQFILIKLAKVGAVAHQVLAAQGVGLVGLVGLVAWEGRPASPETLLEEEGLPQVAHMP
jgi:hypothetical protein